MKIKNCSSLFFRTCAVIGAALLIGARTVSAQSIGANIVTNGAGGIDNTQGNAMLPSDEAGVPSLGLQTNWNNLSGYGSGTFMLTNSLGTAFSFDMQWDSGYTDSTHTREGLGTPDGKLMDGFMISWGPGDASPLGNSVFNSAINDKRLRFQYGFVIRRGRRR